MTIEKWFSIAWLLYFVIAIVAHFKSLEINDAMIVVAIILFCADIYYTVFKKPE